MATKPQPMSLVELGEALTKQTSQDAVTLGRLLSEWTGSPSTLGQVSTTLNALPSGIIKLNISIELSNSNLFLLVSRKLRAIPSFLGGGTK